MCDPASIAGFGLALGGTALQNSAAARVQRDQDNRYADESKRQSRYSDESNALFQDSLSQSTRQADSRRLGDAVASRQQTYSNALDAPPSAPGTAATEKNAPAVIGAEEARQGARTSRKSAGLANALARLSGYGDATQTAGIGRNRNAAKIGTTGTLARASSNVLPLELEAAKSAGNKRAMLGQLLTLAGAGVNASSGFNSLFSGSGAPTQLMPGATGVAKAGTQFPPGALYTIPGGGLY